MKNKFMKSGFTLVELMVVVMVIMLLMSIAIPNLVRARRNSRIARVANDLRIFSDAFQLYSLTVGLFPADAHIVLPPGMDQYINPSSWGADALGGNYNWEGPTWGEGGTYPYAGISLFGTTASLVELQQLDQTIDDGDLTTGKFRQTPNSRYTYIIEE